MDKKQERKELLQRVNETISEARQLLAENGVTYDLSQWLTVKRYCEKFGIANTQTVSNWISRGIIPPENVVEIPELNNIRLIRAIKYQD